MIKKILPISVFVLVFVIILLLGLQNMLSNRGGQTGVAVTPTMIPGKQGSYTPQRGVTGTTTSPGQTERINTTTTQVLSPQEFQQKLPINSPEFTIDFSSRMQKYVVTLKTENGQAAYEQWLLQNTSLAPHLAPEQVVIAHQTVAELNAALDEAKKNILTPEEEFKKSTDTILTILNTLYAPISLPETTPSPTPLPVVFPTLTPIPLQTQIQNTPYPQNPQTNSGSNGYVYYAQCGGAYDKSPLPNGCTLCAAGCGPTTAAMILASYVDSSLTPPKVVAAMNDANVAIGCQGSGIYQIYGYMSKINGIKVSSMMTLGSAPASIAAVDFRNYINSGWTIFALSNHVYGGHYFWITDVTSDGKILAYDPAYGSGRPTPLNENSYAPYPYYLYAFAVKKN